MWNTFISVVQLVCYLPLRAMFTFLLWPLGNLVETWCKFLLISQSSFCLLIGLMVFGLLPHSIFIVLNSVSNWQIFGKVKNLHLFHLIHTLSFPVCMLSGSEMLLKASNWDKGFAQMVLGKLEERRGRKTRDSETKGGAANPLGMCHHGFCEAPWKLSPAKTFWSVIENTPSGMSSVKERIRFLHPLCQL